MDWEGVWRSLWADPVTGMEAPKPLPEKLWCLLVIYTLFSPGSHKPSPRSIRGCSRLARQNLETSQCVSPHDPGKGHLPG